MTLYASLILILAGLIAFGYAIKRFKSLRETVLSGSGLILLAMASLGGYILQLLPFYIDYSEVLNLAQKAEENIHWPTEECKSILLTVTFAGSFCIFLGGFCTEYFYRDKKFSYLEILGVLCLLSIGLATQGAVIYYNHAIHIDAYNYIDHEPVDAFAGRTRFMGGVIAVAMNVTFSMLSVAWPFIFERFRTKEYDEKKESKPVPAKEEKDDKPIGAPDTVRTGDYKPESMNLNVPVLNKPDENFPLPFNLRA